MAEAINEVVTESVHLQHYGMNLEAMVDNRCEKTAPTDTFYNVRLSHDL